MRWVDATGLEYMRARNHDRTVGRFLNRDTYGGAAAKSYDLPQFGQQVSALSKYAHSQGVQAYFLYDQGTPQSVLTIAARWVGAGNVIALP